VVAPLQIAYHPNFKSRHTLLFAGSRDSIDLLRSFFFGWNGDELDLIQYLQMQGEIHLFSVSMLCLRRDTEQNSFIWNQDRGTWRISEAYQRQILDLLDGLLSAEAGHQYLETGCAHVQIIVSKDEGYALQSGEDLPALPE
jgi:hypothetical protein